MERFIYVQIDPMIDLSESSQEAAHLTARMENFVSWYRYIYQDQSKAFEITESLREIVQGFTHFKFIKSGEKQRILKLHFSLGNDTRNTIGYAFDELSDGQRALVVLYSLVYYARAEDYTLCIDEPENFIALREIQPWLTLLYDYCGDRDLQALLISHHPELINYLAFAGYWFERDHNNAPVRVKPVTDDHDTGLKIRSLWRGGGSMSRQGMRLVILCEDLQQEVFARPFFFRRGFHRHKIQIIRNSNAKGSAEQFVRTYYAQEVRAYRSKSTYLSRGLVVVIDADTYTVEQRLKQLDSALEATGQPKRQPNEKMAIFVPKRNIETWIHYLMGESVDEASAYSKFSGHERKCKSYVDELVKKICPVGLPEDAPPSLHAACEELQRIL